MSSVFDTSSSIRMTEYRAAVTRGYPHWTATITGGDLPESGHVISSLSYVRLCDEITDWLEWHYEQLPDADEPVIDGDGFRIQHDLPELVMKARERYRAARREQAQAVSDLSEGLRASDEDVARLLGIREA